MKLREMRYARIDGTEVQVQVASEKEARAAIKEAVRARRTIERAEAAAERDARRRGLLATLRRVSRVFTRRQPLPDLASLEGDLENTDEILHNIDSCIVQLEGRLLG